MKAPLTLILIVAIQAVFGQNTKNQTDTSRFVADNLEGVYIPLDIDDCIRQIDGFWDDTIKVEVARKTEDQFGGEAHFAIGLWMRNNWKLWGGSRLSRYFKNMGVNHPDDMSGIILTSYHRYLTGKPINLKEQIEYYQAFWNVSKKPLKEEYPENVDDLEFNEGKHYNTEKGNLPGFVHIQTNSNSDSTWIYDFHYGWKQLTRTELNQLHYTTYDNRDSTLNEIFKKTTVPNIH